MANTINDLYLKYVNKVGRSLENDRYFQYLFEIVQAGSHTLLQKNQIMHKVVDERWIEIIEDSLDAINNIIDKPRRFIATNEEVVPVALAKKISADSVRHLSMNTQFIAANDNGEIMPSKILNVTTEESYDLYENRFIYHLIQRLVAFIDKRTDVIFWSTGDEKRHTLSLQSKIDDAYEEIEYKVEMTVKNRQSYAENDSDNMSVFMRIDRLRRMTISLRNSSFCDIMSGCAKVHSPIQRTNLMMKDPDYRKCYKLWQFLESYDEIGYSIETMDSALEFDEEYLIQLYINLITNYTVFKSLLETDQRNILEATNKHRRVTKPKFIKQIKEEIVEDYNLPDVEVKRVLIEEVTQGQLDAEAALAQAEEKCKALQELQDSLESQMQMLYQQINTANELQVEAERKAWDDRKARDEAVARADAAEEAAKDAKATANAAVLAKEEAENNLQITISNYKEEMAALKQSTMEEIEAIKNKAYSDVENANKEKEQAIENITADFDKQILEIERERDSVVEKLKLQNEEEIERLKLQNEEEIERLKLQNEEEIERLRSSYEKDIDKLENDHSLALDRINKARAEQFSALEQKKNSELEALRAEKDTMLSFANEKLESERLLREEAEQRALDEETKRVIAEERAEGNRISRLLGDAINESRENRKERRNSVKRLREEIRSELEIEMKAGLEAKIRAELEEQLRSEIEQSLQKRENTEV